MYTKHKNWEFCKKHWLAKKKKKKKKRKKIGRENIWFAIFGSAILFWHSNLAHEPTLTDGINLQIFQFIGRWIFGSI